ncbi:MAG: chemotaxis protein CheD [Desulfuromonadaceae bacterium]|jgi:chemotaxis protein CheD
MKSRERVGIAEFRVVRYPGILISYGLGSCLGIALYDSYRQQGGLAHSLLPGSCPPGFSGRPAKFVEGAIRSMFVELLAAGSEPRHLTAKLAGGANMFASPNAVEEDNIGSRNVRTGREILNQLGIALVAEDVGGRHGRTIEFDLATGALQVRSLRLGELII